MNSGRKPMVIFFFFESMLMPLSVVFSGNDFGPVASLILLGATTMGCFPIVLATIPSETIPHEYLAQTLGLIMGIGELVGGFAAPAIAGWSADTFGINAPFFIAAGAVLIAAFVGFL
jgi:fucose permease